MNAQKSAKVLAGLVCFGLSLAVGATTTWTYTPGQDGVVIGTIDDGQWTLKVCEFDRENGILSFVMSEAWGDPVVKAWQEPADAAKKGVLDLRSPVIVENADAGQISTEIKAIHLGHYAFGCKDSWTLASNLTEFRCDVIGRMIGESNFANDSNLAKLEICGAAECIPQLMLANDPALKEIRLDFPKLRSVGSSWSIFGGDGSSTHPDAIDVAAILNADVTDVCNWALSDPCVTGDLVLSNVLNVGEGAFHKTTLSTVFLKGALAEIRQLTFGALDNDDNPSITNVVLDLPQLSAVSATAFEHQKYILSLELPSALKVMGRVTNILSAAAGGAMFKGLGDEVGMKKGQTAWVPNDLRIYVSKNQWTPSAAEIYSESNPTGFFLGRETFTDKEKEMIAADSSLAKAFGVLVIPKGNGGICRKAFFVHKPSIHDKVGMLISVR